MTDRPPPKIGAPPRVRLSLAVTGHRLDNAAFAANRARVAAVMGELFDRIDSVVGAEPRLSGPDSIAPTRLHCLLSDGVDQAAAHEALGRGWELVAPLPFGLDLNVAISASPLSAADARALIEGRDPPDADTLARAQSIRVLAAAAHMFTLADQDAMIAALLLAKFERPGDARAADTFAAHCSERVGAAARVMLEQSDILFGVWDGATHAFVGGTGHTIVTALEMGAPVVWIDARAPETWRILRTVEALAAVQGGGDAGGDRMDELSALVRAALRPAGAGASSPASAHAAIKALDLESWHATSDRLWHAYRRVEALFGGPAPLRNLRQTYETPDQIGAGSGADVLAAMRALPGGDPELVTKIEVDVLRRFAWADAVSARLSDAYRGGMVANFILSALAIISGIAYLPFALSSEAALFAAVEIVFLGAILLITWFGQRRRWHGRWFETRRVAEYFRHSPILLALGVARAPGRWPVGAGTSWPEWYALHGLREVGLPHIALTRAYLRTALNDLLDSHVIRQRDYHEGKAKRLTDVRRNLDLLSARLFVLALISVGFTLLLLAVQALSLITHALARDISEWSTFLDIILPTLGGAISGIRYFGDFERFAAISEVTAKKLDGLHARILPLLSAPDEALEYGLVASLAHAADDIVVGEIENWQAVFGSKGITVPV